MRRDWDQITKAYGRGHISPYLVRLRGVFDGATELVRKGHVGTLIESIQAETLAELIDQADDLLANGYLAAAAGIAGGALEAHLRHLVDRNSLEFDGHGSIGKYNDLIGQARRAGNEIYSKGDTQLVTGWGTLRNDADHDPMNFGKSKEQVSLMIQGIRNFLVRVP